MVHIYLERDEGHAHIAAYRNAESARKHADDCAQYQTRLTGTPHYVLVDSDGDMWVLIEPEATSV